MSSSPITIEHYERTEVRDIILRQCENGGGLRALNGDNGWYVRQDNEVRLRGRDDFDDTISRARTLYITADIFDPAVFKTSVPWEEGRGGEGRPAFPLGTRGDLVSYSLFIDIDATKDPNDEGNRSKIYHEGRIEALEAAAAFAVKHLKDRGISESVGVLFSGRGVYVWLHPGLSDASDNRALPNFDRQKQDDDFKVWFEAFNALIYDIERAFFEASPEHVGRVKFDKLNNQKRKIKCLLSIHKTLPFAVVPLDKDDIKIDLDRARISPGSGLKEETIADAGLWLEHWTTGEGERRALVDILKPYAAEARKDMARRVDAQDEISRAPVTVPVADWCPFYRALTTFSGGEGSHRVCGALAAWLYQAGWEEDEAFDLWADVATRCDVESRIFYTSYGVIHSPSCKTIKKTSAGYPVLGFGGMGLCAPNEKCVGATWPGHYGCDHKDDDDLCKCAALVDLSTMNWSGKTLVGPHPYHGSESGQNFVIDTEKDVWHCHRCGGGGGPDKLRLVILGLMDCADEYIETDEFVARLIARNNPDIKHMPQTNTWFLWDGKCWARDHTKHIENVVREFIATNLDGRLRVDMSHNSTMLRVIRALSTMPGVVSRPEDFDNDPTLLNVGTGVLHSIGSDIEILEQDKKYMCSMTATDYDPEAKCYRWEQFMAEVLPDKDTRHYVHKAIGYSLFGATNEKCFFFLYGPLGDSGKSLIVETVMHVLGSYSITLPISSFMKKRGGGEVREDLVALKGVRFVGTAEPDDQSRFDMEVIKPLTGSDTIRARGLYQSGIQFRPQAKIWMTGNNLPFMSETNAAAWNRVKLITLPESFTDRKERGLEALLRSESSGILNWCIEGYRMYLEEGLTASRCMAKAVEDYKMGCNSVAEFIANCCVMDGTSMVSVTRFHDTYKTYCSVEGLPPYNRRRMTQSLESMGFSKVKQSGSGGRWYWNGLRIEIQWERVENELLDVVEAA